MFMVLFYRREQQLEGSNTALDVKWNDTKSFCLIVSLDRHDVANSSMQIIVLFWVGKILWLNN